MRRRTNSQTDSLELLLDTICNMFGGIVFIALLVIIMLQLSGSEVTTEKMVSADEVEILENELAAAQSEQQKLKENVASQQAAIDDLIPEEFQESLNECEALDAQAESLEEQKDKLTMQNVESLADLQKQKEQMETLATDLEKAKTDATKLDRELDQLKERVATRLPYTRRPPKIVYDLQINLRYGRMYIWHTYDAFGNKTGLNLQDYIVIGEDSKKVYTAPKPTAGIPLDETPECRDRVLRRISRFSRSKFVVDVLVRPDSAEQWRYLRDIVVNAGYRYRLLVRKEGDEVIDRGGEIKQIQ